VVLRAGCDESVEYVPVVPEDDPEYELAEPADSAVPELPDDVELVTGAAAPCRAASE
jgi:hypothetical protein